jgi:hypothetical protein
MLSRRPKYKTQPILPICGLDFLPVLKASAFVGGVEAHLPLCSYSQLYQQQEKIAGHVCGQPWCIRFFSSSARHSRRVSRRGDNGRRAVTLYDGRQADIRLQSIERIDIIVMLWYSRLSADFPCCSYPC